MINLLSNQGILLAAVFCIFLICFIDAVISPNDVSLRVKGPPSVVIQLKSGRTISGHSTILQNNAPLGLWCQAVDAKTYKVIPAKEIYFRHNGHRIPAVFTDDSHQNATLVHELVAVEDAGRWTCHVQTADYGNATGDIMVYLRPVINTSMRVDDRSSSKYYFDLSGLTVVNEEDARLECPVTGNPKPEITWKRNNQNIKQIHNPRITVHGNVLEIRNVTNTDSGTYTCIGSNTIFHKDDSQTFEVRADRNLRVKSKYAWVAPLIVIAVIIILLIMTIVLCELRKRRQPPKLLASEED